MTNERGSVLLSRQALEAIEKTNKERYRLATERPNDFNAPEAYGRDGRRFDTFVETTYAGKGTEAEKLAKELTGVFSREYKARGNGGSDPLRRAHDIISADQKGDNGIGEIIYRTGPSAGGSEFTTGLRRVGASSGMSSVFIGRGEPIPDKNEVPTAGISPLEGEPEGHLVDEANRNNILIRSMFMAVGPAAPEREDLAAGAAAAGKKWQEQADRDAVAASTAGSKKWKSFGEYAKLFGRILDPRDQDGLGKFLSAYDDAAGLTIAGGLGKSLMRKPIVKKNPKRLTTDGLPKTHTPTGSDIPDFIKYPGGGMRAKFGTTVRPGEALVPAKYISLY